MVLFHFKVDESEVQEKQQRIRNQLKVVPELQFFLDDSLEYIDNIDHLLQKEE